MIRILTSFKLNERFMYSLKKMEVLYLMKTFLECVPRLEKHLFKILLYVDYAVNSDIVKTQCMFPKQCICINIYINSTPFANEVT